MDLTIAFFWVLYWVHNITGELNYTKKNVMLYFSIQNRSFSFPNYNVWPTLVSSSEVQDTPVQILHLIHLWIIRENGIPRTDST
jgi:hypothetical protein